MPQSSTLGPFPYDIFINELDENREHMLIKFPDKTELGEIITLNMLEEIIKNPRPQKAEKMS